MLRELIYLSIEIYIYALYIKNTFWEEDGKSLSCAAVSSRTLILDLHIIYLVKSILLGPLKMANKFH